MTTKSYFRGHPIIWIGDPDTGRWVYKDNMEDLPATGGKTRPCKKCGELYGLGEGEVDPCLGILPGVDNACCGHGVSEESYIRFTNGLIVKNFEIDRKLLKKN